MTIDISVLIATHNGGPTIGRTLARLADIEQPRGAWEVIVVDNASTDDTLSAVGSFGERLPLRTVQCPQRGKNRALNMGLEHVRGDVVVLIDDDILPEEHWFGAIERHAVRHPNVDIFGGPIAPLWVKEPPSWLDDAVPFGPVFGVTPEDLPEGPVDPGRIWGGNMVVRRRVFERGLRFDESRGPGTGNYVMGGDTEFTCRAAAQGHRTWWCPDVRVRHLIRAEQLSRRWLLRRAYRHGKSVFMGTARKAEAVSSRLGFPRSMLRKAAETAVAAAVRDLTGDRTGALRLWWRFFHLCGYMVQARAVKVRCA